MHQPEGLSSSIAAQYDARALASTRGKGFAGINGKNAWWLNESSGLHHHEIRYG